MELTHDHECITPKKYVFLSPGGLKCSFCESIVKVGVTL